MGGGTGDLFLPLFSCLKKIVLLIVLFISSFFLDFANVIVNLLCQFLSLETYIGNRRKTMRFLGGVYLCVIFTSTDRRGRKKEGQNWLFQVKGWIVKLIISTFVFWFLFGFSLLGFFLSIFFFYLPFLCMYIYQSSISGWHSGRAIDEGDRRKSSSDYFQWWDKYIVCSSPDLVSLLSFFLFFFLCCVCLSVSGWHSGRPISGGGSRKRRPDDLKWSNSRYYACLHPCPSVMLIWNQMNARL